MNKTFADLGYNAGDTVRCVDDRNRVDDGGCLIYVTGYEYLLRHTTIEPRTNCGHNGYSATWELVSRAGSTDDADDEYLNWRNMTPEAQGALMLSLHNGATIQVFSVSSDKWVDTRKPMWVDYIKYRVRTADPVVLTHEVSGYVGGPWSEQKIKIDTQKITYNTIDGLVDYDSVKMMEI